VSWLKSFQQKFHQVPDNGSYDVAVLPGSQDGQGKVSVTVVSQVLVLLSYLKSQCCCCISSLSVAVVSQVSVLLSYLKSQCYCRISSLSAAVINVKNLSSLKLGVRTTW